MSRTTAAILCAGLVLSPLVADAASITADVDPVTGASTLTGSLGPFDPGRNTISGSIAGSCLPDGNLVSCVTDDEVDFSFVTEATDTVTLLELAITDFTGDFDNASGGAVQYDYFLDPAGPGGFGQSGLVNSSFTVDFLESRDPLAGGSAFRLDFQDGRAALGEPRDFSFDYTVTLDIERTPPVVPVPSGLPLALTGLGALWYLRRRTARIG